MRLNPNTASPTDLALLPRIGEVTAQRIVAFREENKPQDGRPVFQSANDLERVRGIGPVTIARIERYLKFDSHCRIHECESGTR
ncbi:MAG: helix-hairpin-helix domain-containing protein [Phycisphaerales bacterium]|nr:helix-hairpin-helix domain-containing protein [Phycisphaerales bacterium]